MFYHPTLTIYQDDSDLKVKLHFMCVFLWLQLPAVAQRLREREFRVADLLQALLRYFEECRTEEEPEAGDTRRHKSLFQWLLEQA